MAVLLLHKGASQWVQGENGDEHGKAEKILRDVNQAIENGSLKIVKPLMFLLWVMSFHEAEYLWKSG